MFSLAPSAVSDAFSTSSAQTALYILCFIYSSSTPTYVYILFSGASDVRKPVDSAVAVTPTNYTVECKSTPSQL